MALATYDTATMMELLQKLQPEAPPMWLSMFFPTVRTFDTQYIDFDSVAARYKRLAPFVAPNVQGQPMKLHGYATNRFAPAYIKPKDVVDPSKAFERRAGEPYGGNLTPDQRMMAARADLIRLHQESIQRRWEVMAAHAVLNGSVVVSGDNYPSQTVSFNRASGHTITLGSGSRWGDSGVNPLTSIETWATTMHTASGYVATVAIMGTSAWAAFSADQNVKDALDRNSRGTERLMLNTLPGDGTSVQYKGTDGSRQYYVYSDFYQDADGTSTVIMDPRDVLMANPAGVQGVRCFGAIMDPRAGYVSVPIFGKNFIQEDPAGEFVMHQSAPLMVPREPNATLKARVVA